jgi:hypothetical protein
MINKSSKMTTKIGKGSVQYFHVRIVKSKREKYLKWSGKTVVEHVKNVQNEGLQCISRYKTMVSPKNTALVKTPCLNQYDTPLE